MVDSSGCEDAVHLGLELDSQLLGLLQSLVDLLLLLSPFLGCEGFGGFMIILRAIFLESVLGPS